MNQVASPPSAKSAVPRRRFFNDMPDRGLFAFVALAGFLAILILKARNFDADLITVVSVALMVGYGAIAYNIPAVHMRLDRLGDNFYYLGFIYTLASLSAAILQWRGGAEPDQLIGSFGIALVTTIFGIGGRVVFAQMRSDIDEIEETIRRDLSKSAADLRGELFAAIREFQTVRTALIQTMQESSAAFAKASELQAGKVEELMRDATKKLDEAFEPGRAGMRQMSEQMKSVSKSAEQAAGRMAKIEIPSEKLNSQLGAFADSLDAQMRRLASTVEDVSRRASLPNEQLNSALADFTKSLEQSLSRLAHTAARGQRPRRRWYWPFSTRKA